MFSTLRARVRGRRQARWLLVAGFTASIAFLASATALGAGSTVVGYFQLSGTSGFVEDPGFITVPAASEVSANGAGGVSPGETYVLDRGRGFNNSTPSYGRVTQLSPSGQPVQLWGSGVVKNGPGNSNEVQAVRVDATGGSFKLSFGGATTADISASASADVMEAALNGLSSIGSDGVSVSGGPGDAGGTTPYLVSFTGPSLGGDNQPLLSATDGSSPLSGSGAEISTYTTIQGGIGFEICRPADGDECGASNGGGDAASDLEGTVFRYRAGLAGALFQPRDIAVDQGSGVVYIVNRERVEAYSATGEFLRAWGQDVVASGPDDSIGHDEQQAVTVNASGGTFKLAFSPAANLAEPRQETAPIPYGASAATVKSALDQLDTVGGAQSSVSVSGDGTAPDPYLVTFHGLLSGDDVAAIQTDASGLTGGGSMSVATIVDGGGYEICVSDDACKNGVISGAAGSLRTAPSIAVAPVGAPNAGNVLVSDSENHRIQEFTSGGDFVRAFGWDVDGANPSTGFEVCTVPSDCKAGTQGTGVGQLAFATGVAEDASGSIYTVESDLLANLGRRAQKFTPAGGLDLTPSLFGTDEVQELTVNASAGKFRLTFGSEREGTQGTGILTKGSPVITNVTTTTGAFTVGQPIKTFNGFLDDYIVAVGPNTVTVSKPLTNAGCCQETLVSNRPYTTPDLPHDASPGEVQSALDAIPAIGSGGSVSVQEGNGGPSSYSISFDGGSLARTDPAQITASNGSIPLSGGSGPGAGAATVSTLIPGGPAGTEPLSQPRSSSPVDVAIGPGGRIFVAKLFPGAYENCPSGAPTLPQTRIQELDSSGAVLGTSDPCIDPEQYGYPGNLVSDSGGHTPSLSVNPATGYSYVFPDDNGARLSIFGPGGPDPDLNLLAVSGITTTGGTISGTINPNGPGDEYPEAVGTPSSYRTAYRIEYRKASESSWTAYTPSIPLGSGTDPVPFSIGIGGLAPKTPYEVKVIATKPFTASVEEVESFTTAAAPPAIESLSASKVTASSALLHAKVNPQGTETTYHFEYGTTTAYGQSTPETGIGDSLQGQAVSEQIEGLEDTVYHFRMVATNSLGTTRSEDQTFTFHPPVCPNQAVRQQTGAAYLPDCRAYELVSPEDAGGATLYTGGPQSPYASNPPRLAFVGQFAAIPGSGRNPINTLGDLYVATRGAEGWRSRYVGPSSEEAGCVGGRPIVSGTGYPTTIQNDVMADPGLGRILDWNLGNPVQCANGIQGNATVFDFNTAARGSNAPYVWNAHGDFLDRWPTSIADVPESEANFSCPQDPSLHPYPQGVSGNIPVPYFCSTYIDASKDLNHFVFSTQSGLFGEGGLTAAPGSAYDNDTANNTLMLVSRGPNGDPIGQEPGAKAGPEELIQFPSVSADGSHILMGTATKPACKQVDYPRSGNGAVLCPVITQPTHLYMRVNNAITYDVSGGNPVRYIGATPDGTKVYFTSEEQLTADDSDESVDLFMWDENNAAPRLVRISKGEPAPTGNTDNCVSTWTNDCDVETYDDSKISTAAGNRGGLGSWEKTNSNPGYTDNAIAAKSGDVYFYSPEQLVAGKGAPGKENVYAYRDGDLQFVAALEDDNYCLPAIAIGVSACSNGALGRLQVTPDGRFAAFVTTSRLTAYDNHGFAEMYRYDAEAETLQCVSCRLDGSAPESDVRGSQGGRFISDDGRVFYSTAEPLEPRDTNAGISAGGKRLGIDVYEFVDGRPQLITSGTGTGAEEGSQASANSMPGLYGVSGDGVDVYFGTTETLVGQDRNGAQLKFYDARTNGGFPFVPPPPPCAAADECHGPTAPAPAPIARGTGASLAGGNVKQKSKPRKQARKHRAKHRKQRKQAQRKRQKAKRAAQHQRGGSR